MQNTNTKHKKHSLENTVKKAYVVNEVTTGSAATIASASPCNTVDIDASNTGSESSKSLVTPYAQDRYYYFENDCMFQKLIEQSDNKIVSRIAIMLYADCVAWNRDVNMYFDSSKDIGDKVRFGKELIKFGYGIIARKCIFYAMFVNIGSTEVKKITCNDDIESYTIKDIEDQIDYMQDMIDDAVSVIIEYGYNNPEIIFAMEVVNSYVM